MGDSNSHAVPPGKSATEQPQPREFKTSKDVLMDIVKSSERPMHVQQAEVELARTGSLGFGLEASSVIRIAVDQGLLNFNRDAKTLSIPNK